MSLEPIPTTAMGDRMAFPCRRPFLLGLVAIGVVLRTFQYAANTSFWFDELSIARNLVHRSLTRLLLEPLGYNQVAPVGFMVVEKLSSLLLGTSDLALRLFPFVCGLAAPLLFWRFAQRTLERYAVPYALATFALGVPFIRYAAELKQYGVDVLAAIALVLMTLRLRDRESTPSACVLAGLAGAALALISQAAVFVMGGIGAALVLSWMRERDARSRRPMLITVPIWAVSSVATIIVALRHITPSTQAFMHAFWKTREGFFPWPLKGPSDLLWIWERLAHLFSSNQVLHYPWPMLYAVLAIVGMAILWRRDRFTALVLLGPFFTTLLAATVQQYPFRMRTVVFLVPSLLLAVAQAAESIRRRVAALHPAIGGVLMAALLAGPVLATAGAPLPYRTEDYNTVLAFVQLHHRPGDTVYVFPNAYEAMERYGPAYGLGRDDYVVAECRGGDTRAYLHDVDRYRGVPRVWLIASSVPPFHPARLSLTRYLGAIGILRESLAIPSEAPLDPVSAELYDLSDKARLASVSAADFPLEPVRNLRLLCGPAMTPDPPDRQTAAGER